MIIVFPYSPKDQDLAAKLSSWIAELGPNKGHKALVCRDARTNPNIDREVKHNLSQVFDSVDSVDVVERMDSDWSAESNTSARAANIMFRTAAKHVQFTDPQPFLWLEPDVVILKSGWMDQVEKEYNADPVKPFMGDFVNFPGVPPHMSGIAVYPGIVVDHAPWATMASTQDTAWDVQAADQIVPKMKQTHLIKHQWKFGGVSNESELDNLLGQCGDAVIFHQDKSGTVIKFLRERKQIAAGTDRTDRSQSLNHSTVLAGLTPARRATTTDILIKSYPPDYEWLGYCLRSIDKFCSGFRQCVLICPDDKCPKPTNLPVKMIVLEEVGNDGYLWQNAVKAQAYKYTDADCILHVDSDCVFTTPVTPETFLINGKPYWLFSAYDKIAVPWQPIMEKFAQRSVPLEYMRRIPTFIPVFVHRATEEYCKVRHGCSLQDYIMQQPYRSFSEFNALGIVADEQFHDKFEWINCHADN